ncbi:hypothetical protein LJC11_00605 [Bacteroidales bacterium OttesenSCG-928-I21]|nr:hypothetical protein [Bacteroidales bacterium OttesenSCG-928-I21]
MNKKENILISPLNWGLGHAARLIPIIKHLDKEGNNLIIGGSGVAIEILKKAFPHLEFVYIPSPTLVYGKRKSFSLVFYLSFIKFIANVFHENFVLRKIISEKNISVVISDNRLGLYNKKIKSIYLSHQLNIYLTTNRKKPSPVATFAHRSYIKKFDYCLVPDIDSVENSLTGRLTENSKNLNLKFIGPISRFEIRKDFYQRKIKYDFVCILSGPEPQRTMLEKKMIDIFDNSNYKIVIIRGLPKCSEKKKDSTSIRFLNHATDSELLDYINCSKRIICRSGYTTIMDLVNIGRRAILIPTPGQSEQEYLALRLSEKHAFVSINQYELNPTSFDVEYDEVWKFENNPNKMKNILNNIIPVNNCV